MLNVNLTIICEENINPSFLSFHLYHNFFKTSHSQIQEPANQRPAQGGFSRFLFIFMGFKQLPALSLKQKLLLFLSCFFVWLKPLQAQAPYYFRHYEVEHGLSNNTVLSSLQDKRGFLWFGTIDGLNRFDGYSFKTFRNDPSDARSLGNNSVYCLYQSKDEMLWVGTNKGLYKYNPVDQSFELVDGTLNKRVRSLCEDASGNLWFRLDLSLASYNDKQKKLKPLTSLKFPITSLCIDHVGNLWVATTTGILKKLNPLNDSAVSYDLFCNSKHASSKYIEKIYDTKKGSLLVGTLNEGIKLFDMATGGYKDIILYNHDKTEIFAKDFVQYSGDDYWAATEYGIFIYNIHSHKFTSLRMQYNNVYSISDNAINTLCKDKEGGIWAGTRFGGISYYPYPYTSFEKYFSQDGKRSISGNGVHEICPDREGNLWIGTEDAGLSKLNTKTGLFRRYVPDGKKGSISYSNIHGLLITGDELWIGTYQYGLDRMDLNTQKVVKHYTAGKNSFNSNFIVHLFKTSKGDILAGSWEGLFKYHKKTDDFSLVPGFAFQTQSILEDKDGLLWICTLGNGVYTLDQKTGKIENLRHINGNENSLSNNMVNGQFKDSHGNLWFATEGGLCKYDPSKKIFKSYTVKNGLPSNFLFKILEDEKNNLWISSTKGLIRFNPQTENLKVFTTANGLLNDQFNWNSAYKDAAGRMYFGSVKGMISFMPEKFTTNTIMPPVYITGIQVYDKELPIGNPQSALKKSITYTDKLTLPYDQSTLSIDFAALSYTSPEMNEYSYKMEGLDKDWTLLKTYRKAYFTQLPPGRYRFKVKASNSSGIWNAKETTLDIEILPPFWKSAWMYLLYVLGGGGLIFYFTRDYHHRIAEKNKRRIELLEYEKEKELYQAKIEFFTNVAHEIRTPLTLIKGPMDKVMDKACDVPGIETSLKIMQRNTNRLIDLTNQLLDFRQTEIKGFRLNFIKTNISEFIEDIHSSFRSLAEQKNLDYSIHLPKVDLHAYVDPDALNKIISNLYSNAVKYAQNKVDVRLLLPRKNDNSFSIIIKNDGFLIPYEMKDKIFEPFFRLKETKMLRGTGIGLALSRSLAELHKGNIVLEAPQEKLNVFKLTLPLQGEWAVSLIEPKEVDAGEKEIAN